MGKRTDIRKVLIIGSGPIIIGQACEFDYSGTQACKALRQLGYEIVLVNSNPATIMTDPATADTVYIEPLNAERLEQIIAKERPDALLPNLGGQSALNLSSELAEKGILDKYGVKVIGVQIDAIKRGEDREAFKETMESLGIDMARSKVAYSVDEAVEIAAELGYPCVLRPAYTMGGTGGGLVYNVEELKTVVARGLAASPVHEVLVEESILGWEELELEVVRDAKGQKITVCFIENIDPMGVHTGDSFCAAPMLTISPEVQKRLQEKSYKVMEAVQVIGGCNVQWAHDPVSDRDIIIEINPRTSRSSALASKATGFPIALISAMLASGLTLDEIPCGKHGTLDKYTPGGDYVVLKFARWAFEKFKGVQDKLGTQMRAVGEVMSIGKTYKEAFQKAIRSLETGRYGLGFAKDFNGKTKEELLALLAYPTSERQFVMYEALRHGATVEELHGLTNIKTYFIEQMKEFVDEEEALRAFGAAHPGELPEPAVLERAKKDGFSDRYLATKVLSGVTEEQIRARREELGIVEGWEGVHVSSTQDSSYYFSTYNAPDAAPASDNPNKIMILGGGPNRIGQGIEFDYCCVHAAKALKKLGFETIIVNCNPETVSTDYDTSDKLYFEPLTAEDVLAIYAKEKPLGVIAQFGGQTPLNLASELERAGVRILGTSPEVIDLAEDRDRFRADMESLGIPMPEAGMAVTVDEALEIAHGIGYPVMVRPSYVLGGRGMEVVYDDDNLRSYMAAAVGVTPDRPILIDRFLHHAPRVRGRRHLRRRARLRARGHGARRARRRALGRLRGHPALGEHHRRAARHHQGVHTPHRRDHARVRPHEHPVRHRGRHGLRARGQPARQPHGAARVQGVRHPDGPDRHRGHDHALHRQALARGRPQGDVLQLLRRQGGRPAVQHVPRGRPGARSRDALHRRGARPGRHLRRGVLQGPGGHPDGAAPVRHRAHERERPRQGRPRGGGQPVCRGRLRASWPPRAPRRDARGGGHPRPQGAQGPGGPSQPGGRSSLNNEVGARAQHAEPLHRERPGRLLHPQGRHQGPRALHDHDGRRQGHRARHRRGQEERRQRRALAAGVPREHRVGERVRARGRARR